MSIPAASHCNLHGVLMEIMGIGVLITGPAGIGKSELALELISRGHVLVADDAPVFTQLPDAPIQGSCPAVLHNYLQVRALGLLDIATLFGEQAVRTNVTLDLIVELEHGRRASHCNLAVTATSTQLVLNRAIDRVCLDAASPRLAVLVESRVRLQLSHLQGRCAERDFSVRHRLAVHSATL